MTPTKRSLNASVLLFCSFLLCSCISIQRNIMINKDGSGSEILTIKFDRQFYEMMSSLASFMDSTRKQGYLDSLYSDEVFINKTKQEYNSIHGLKVIDVYSQKGLDSSNSFIIKYDFDSVQKIGSSLNKLNNNNNDSDKTIVIFSKEGEDIEFSYTYERPSPEGMQNNDSLINKMRQGMAEMFKGDAINFDIQFPYKVTSSNATSSEDNKLVWNFPISEIIINGKMHLEVMMKEN